MTNEEKLEIIRRFENGEGAARIAKDLQQPESTVSYVIKQKEKFNKVKEINRNSTQRQSWVSPQDYMDEIIQEINKNDTNK